MLTLRRIKNHQEELQTLVNNAIEWASPLSFQQYQQREETLNQVAFASSSLRSCWILVNTSVDESDPKEYIVSACETYQRPCRVWVEGAWKQGSCWAVASVFTPPHQRGKGYAGVMMQSLLDKCQQEGMLACILYSDIGPDYYQKWGWTCMPSSAAVFPVDAIPSIVEPFRTITPLTSSDILSYFTHHSLPLPSTTSQPSFLVDLDKDCLEWHFTRAQFISQTLYQKTLSVMGASTQDMQEYCIFTYDFKEKALIVLTMHAPLYAHALLYFASRIAHSFEFHQIIVWDPESAGCHDLSFGHVKERSSSLSHLKVFDSSDRFQWIKNEKYAWV